MSQFKIQKVSRTSCSKKAKMYFSSPVRLESATRVWLNISEWKIGHQRRSTSIPLPCYACNTSLATRIRSTKSSIRVTPVSLLFIPGKEASPLWASSPWLLSSEIDTRALAYMTIDVNRRLMIWYGFVNVLNTLSQLNEQLPICLLNEVGKECSVSYETDRVRLAPADRHLHHDAPSFVMDLFFGYHDHEDLWSSDKESAPQSVLPVLSQSIVWSISSKCNDCRVLMLNRKRQWLAIWRLSRRVSRDRHCIGNACLWRETQASNSSCSSKTIVVTNPSRTELLLMVCTAILFIWFSQPSRKSAALDFEC